MLQFINVGGRNQLVVVLHFTPCPRTSNCTATNTTEPPPLLPLVMMCYPQIDHRDSPEISVRPDQGCHLSGARTVVVRRITEIFASCPREYICSKFKILTLDVQLSIDYMWYLTVAGTRLIRELRVTADGSSRAEAYM